MSHVSDPAIHHEAITPHDSTDQPNGMFRSIYVGGAGNISVVVNGVALTYVGQPAGNVLNVRGTRVNSTGTTATNLIAWY